MLDKWNQGRESAELVRDEIIDFSVGFYKENPEQEIKLEHIVLLTRILRDNYAKAEREDIASLFDLAAEKFPHTRWMYILSEVEKQVNSAIPETESSSNLKSGNDKANPSLKTSRKTSNTPQKKNEKLEKGSDFGILYSAFMKKHSISEKQLKKAIATGKVSTRIFPDGLYIEDKPFHKSLNPVADFFIAIVFLFFAFILMLALFTA